MTCDHKKGDPDCGRDRHYTPEIKTPDSSNYEIIAVAPINNHLVLQVKYPNCKDCTYEGKKTIVFLNTSPIDAMKWKRIDPHFRDPKIKKDKEAPPPSARFPGNDEGWMDACDYARNKK